MVEFQIKVEAHYYYYYYYYIYCFGCAIAQAVNHGSLVPQVRFESQARPCEINGRQNGNGTGFSPRTSVSTVNTISSVFHTR